MEDSLGDVVRDVKEGWAEAPYYDDAEDHLQGWWDDLIHPAIRRCDFSRVLELAPGHGRNTARLLELADEIHLVDVNETCIERCRQRFADHAGPCRLRYHVNDGQSLPMFEPGSVSLVYCWDAMVHFDPRLVRVYLEEFARVLRPGGHAALHYSNYRALHDGPGRTWRENPHWRSEMSRDLFRGFCDELGLAVELETLLGWGGIEDLDVGTLVCKPAAT